MENVGHAVLLVSYRTKTGKLDDMEFLFKNSYGDHWGDRGYGMVTYNYLEKNLHDALFLVAH
jgi:C1A family cysteine protease